MDEPDEEEPERPSIGGSGFGAGLGFNSGSSGLGANANGACNEEEEEEEDSRPAFGGLGFGGTRAHMAGFGLGLNKASDDNEDEGAI
ncbi:uncharacterized protein MYCFIDRAFT_212206 [Pseudocercospora fijiensis CIRAD86]|uniref:Uncharacterized protein n=1 Tax=Pseudocercospora fijiensis (strain CIRAD86) TaxID=383855 RepID=M3APM4_PSEFD|nr:uncharacterized protein MYCFIDRAFT_212206 [Pseudocercospora fijiensis CIRAD86]EME79392.1 hypothetical protein MYCFIDRAFT_212206 [Pseudocercospora fijiensis CIRAD86]